jgi:hypothetical protein
MILKFPDLETLRLALLTGAVPAAVSAAPARAGLADQGPVWVEPEVSLSRPALAELRKLGIVSIRSSEGVAVPVSCWAEMLPLRPDPTPVQRLEQTPVVFDLAAGAGLARLVLEILRLGNDRVTYRWLESGAGDRALLRVVGPPYYALLRAIDNIGGIEAPTAFIERAPRVWVQVGYAHPLAEHLLPPKGKLLFLRVPRRWELLADAPFQDIYGVLEFPLPDAAVAYVDGDLAERLRVTPTLRSGGAPDGAELWVLRDNALAELNRFVQNADDQLLHRLNFAVGQTGDRTTIVLRVRQSKLPPPVLVLPAIGYKPYLKLPNLFLPVGTRLHPPLRRDAVRKLLADDPDQVVWLHPDGATGPFTPESLPEGSFRPLWDWIDYVLDRERDALTAWIQAATFDFEGFICEDEHSPRTRKPGEGKGGGRSRDDNRNDPVVTGGPTIEFANRSRKANVTEEEDFAELGKIEPSELQRRQRALEERFLAVEGGLDSPDRLTLWPELAEVNAALGSYEDAGTCWLNALWPQDPVPVDWCWRWFRAEAGAVAGRPGEITWVARATVGKGREVPGTDLDRLLALPEPTAADLRTLAAYLVFAARSTPPPGPLLERLSPLQRFLQAHERLLPVRAVWLAWSHLVRLARTDVLALARARDRLLERLFQNGLRPEQDLPGFLRFAGQPTSQRFRGARQWMTRLAGLAHDWVRKQPVADLKQKGPMEGYVDLTFAFGLARLGEQDAARASLQRARLALRDGGEVHAFLFGAYEYRIKQALEGKPHAGPLPIEHVEYLEHLEAMTRYAIDRLRNHSRILEPNEQVQPYRHAFRGTRINELDQSINELADIHDRKAVIHRVESLLKSLGEKAKRHEDRGRILRAALEVAPRVSEEFARQLLDQVPATWDALLDVGDALMLPDLAQFLEKGLSVAAHFGRTEHVQLFVARFQKMLQTQKGKQVGEAFEVLAGQCFRGLRKLGMRDEIDTLLTQMADLILEGRDVRDVDPATSDWSVSLRALLHVAGGWYYFGRDRQAEPIMQAAHRMLLREDQLWDDPMRNRATEKTKLACTYASTLGQAPMELAQKRFEELFHKLTGIHDNYTTHEYYSRTQLAVVEEVVRAVVSDDFTLGSHARRWLDDDEFLVRRRIHRDWGTLAQG